MATQNSVNNRMDSPFFSGIPIANTATLGTNTAQLATTAFVIANAGLAAANQTQMEAATSNTVAATPGTTQYHPGVAKAWVRYTTTTTTAINNSLNIASITDNGVGDTTVTFTTSFSSTGYCALESTRANAGNFLFAQRANSSTYDATASSYRTLQSTQAGAAADTKDSMMVFFGDQ